MNKLADHCLTEDAECRLFVRWLETLGDRVRFSHLPLETHTTAINAARLKSMGVRKGVPDYLLIVGKHIVFVEMKRRRGGVVSAHQREWLAALDAAGAHCHVCLGHHEAMSTVLHYLQLPT